MIQQFWRRVVAVAVATAAFGSVQVTALAQMGTGAVVGTVTTADGTPVSGAVVTLSGNGIERKTTTDAHGEFGLAGVYGGTYNVRADAKGFDPVFGRTLDVPTGGAARLALALARSATSLAVIGQVSANGKQTVSTRRRRSSTLILRTMRRSAIPASAMYSTTPSRRR